MNALFLPAPSTPALNAAPPEGAKDETLYCVRLDDRGDLCVYVWADPYDVRSMDDALELAEEYAEREYEGEYDPEDLLVWEVIDDDERAAVRARSEQTL